MNENWHAGKNIASGQCDATCTCIWLWGDHTMKVKRNFVQVTEVVEAYCAAKFS